MDNEIEPDAVPDAVPDVPPTVVEHPEHEPKTDVGERLDKLESMIFGLTEKVENLAAPKVEHVEHEEHEEVEHDESPVSKPWTHRGFGNH